MTLEPDYGLKEIADALGMSERWVRTQVSNGAEHLRYGHKIKMTGEQVEKLRAANMRNAVPESITTGRRRRAS